MRGRWKVRVRLPLSKELSDVAFETSAKRLQGIDGDVLFGHLEAVKSGLGDPELLRELTMGLVSSTSS